MKALTLILAFGFPAMVSAQGFEDWNAETEDPSVTYSLTEYDPYAPNYEQAGAYKKVAVTDRRTVPYPHLREGDVAWARRYERIIDARQKLNIVMLYPKTSFPNLLMKVAAGGMVPAYAGRDFDSIIPYDKINQIGQTCMLVGIPDSIDPSIVVDKMVCEGLRITQITKFRIMEEWIFDKKHGRMIPRIVAIAPLYKPNIGGIVDLAEQPMFWIKYEDLRPTLVNSEVFNRKNDAARISYDHFFEARMFDSYIVREPNVMDIDIPHYPEYENYTLGALLEAEVVKNDLFLTEHDLWEY